MILRLTERAKKISHVQKIMYYWRSHSGSVASGIEAKTYAVDAAKRAVSAHLKRKGFNNFEISSTRAFATIFRIAYEIKEYPLVSIIIPNKDHVEDLRRCINSILERTFYNNFEIVIVENNSKKKETFDYYQELSKDRRIKVVTYTGRFNYSAINNLGVKESSGEYLLFLNNDCEVITRLWIEEMLMYAQREDVGAVGVKLLYPNREIQHAGIVIGMGEHRVAGHVMCRFPYGVSGYMGKLWYAQNVSAVTAACMMVKKSKYDAVNGMDEGLEVCFNDVDFCLKLRIEGYLNIFTPFAELFHYESLSRGTDSTPEKQERFNKEKTYFKTKWSDILEKGDPYYNPNMTLDYADCTVITDYTY